MASPLNCELTNQIGNLSAVAVGLEEYKRNITLGGMSRELAVSLESFTPGILNNAPINSFTLLPSSTKRDFALEAIDWKRVGTIATIASTLAFAIYKFFKWICEKLEKYFNKDSAKAKASVKGTATAAQNAAANACPVEPKDQDDIDINDRRLLKRIIHPSAHPLNPVLYLLHDVGKQNKLNDAAIIAASMELESLYHKLGDDYMGSLTALVMDFNANAFSGILKCCQPTAGERGNYFNDDNLTGVLCALDGTSSMIYNLQGMCKRLKTDNVANLGRNMQQLESSINEMIKDINLKTSTSAFTITVDTFKSLQSKDTGKVIDMPSRYKVTETDAVIELMQEIANNRELKFSIWNRPGTTQPSKDFYWFKQLVSTDTVTKLERFFEVDEAIPRKTVNEYRELAKKLIKDTETLKRELDGLKNHPIMKQYCTYGASVLSNDPVEYQSTPAELIARSLSLVEAVNRITSKHVMQYCILDRAMVKFLATIKAGSEQYIKIVANK